MLFFVGRSGSGIAVRVFRARPEELEARARLALEGERGNGADDPVRPRTERLNERRPWHVYEDKVLHELDGIKEYDNAMPGWLMAIWWGSLIFSAAYLIFYALSFGEGSMDSEYRGDTQTALTAMQAHFDANPLVPPSPATLLAGAKDAAVLDVGAARFAKIVRAVPRREGPGPDRPEPHRRSLDPRRVGRAGLPDRSPRAGRPRACRPGAAR